MDELLDLLAGRNPDMALDRAALQLATIEFPGLEIDPFLSLLDSYAVELAGRVGDGSDAVEYISAMNEFLFGELGFSGNAKDYYNPRNSCLNEVLTARVGIPITLSVVYIEIARRLAKPIHGVGLPGHFVVEYNDGAFSTFIDPFHGGAMLTTVDCLRLARDVAGVEVADESVLAPVTNRQILFRMINNLRGIYFSRRAHHKALQLLNLLIAANPAAPEEYKQRGLVHLQLKNVSAAKADLEKYLALAPEAPDRAEIQKQVRALKQWLVGMN